MMRHHPRRVFALLIGVTIILAATAHAWSGSSSRALASCGGSPVAASPAPSPAASPTNAARSVSVANSVTITLSDQEFNPAIVEATSGHPLTITLRNIGSCRHGFRLDRFGIDVILDPATTGVVVIQTPALGDFAFTSPVDGDEAMRGRLTFYI